MAADEPSTWPMNIDPRLHLTPTPTPTAPTPPPHLFRTVRLLSPPSSKTAVWLCLPRKLEPIQISNRTRAVHPLIRRLAARDLTIFKNKSRSMTPHLSVVKMSTGTAALRRESEALTALFDDGNVARGQTLRRVQLTGAPESSFLAFRPVFGCTIERFGKRCLDGRAAIPEWLFWHIFVDMVKGMEVLHARGIMGWWGSAEAEGNVLLDLYGDEEGFRDYPRVVFVGVKHGGGTDEESAEKDVRSMMAFLGKVAGTMTDGGMLGWFVKKGDDPLVVFEREWTVEGGGEENMLEQVKRRWWEAALKGREDGPKRLPRELAQWIHDDLASEEELSGARSMVLHLGASIGQFRELVNGQMER